MEKNQEIAKYKAGRIMVIFFAVISILNCTVLALLLNGTLVLASIVPQLALSVVLQGSDIFSALLMIVFLVILPNAVYLVSYFLSKNNYKWLLPPIAMMGADLAVLLYYLITSGYITSAIPDLLIEGMVLYSVVVAYLKGKKLGNDYTVVNEKPTNNNAGGKKIYDYSKEMAKENRTNKNVLFYGVFGLLALTIYVGSTVISNNSEALGSTLVFTLNTILIIVILAVYVVVAVVLSPYTSASTTYFYKDKGVVYKADKQMTGNEYPLQDLEIVSETTSEYICTFYNGKKTKKIIIPKCFKDIEEILK